MIGFYSSYLEFIGAIYFSMSLDEILKKRIWSPQDEKKQRRVLEALGEYKDKNFVKAVVDANQAKGAILQAELNKKSVIGLFVIAFLLLLCGFESYWGNTHDNVDLFNFHLCVAYTMSTFLVSLFFLQWTVFNKWKYSVVYICSLLFFFALIFGFNLTYGECKVEKFLVKHIGLFVCVVVTIPVIWQLFITWIYKSVFYGFIKDKIISAMDKYQHIIEDIKNGYYDRIPKEYHEIYMRISQNAPDAIVQKAMDDSLNEYQGILYNDIRTIGNNIKLYHLIFSWFIYKIKSLRFFLKGLFKSNSLIAQKNKLQVKDYAFYAEKYNNQKNRDKSLKMKVFCEKEGINLQEFNAYLNKYCRNK